MKAMTCREVAEKFAGIGSEANGLQYIAYRRVVEVCRQHLAHKARAIRKLRRLAAACGKMPISSVLAIAARRLAGTPSD